MSIDPRFGNTSHAFSCTFLPALAALVASLGCAGGRPVGPWEQKAQLGESDTNCYLSSFF